jgi:tetratricopeptide (TPR) repeat protein
VALFDRALACDPMMVGARYGRALALDASGDIEDARKSYLRVAELSPSSAAGFAGLASMHCELGEIDEADANVERARMLGPDESTTILALASCDIARGLHRQATEKLQVMLGHATIAPIDTVRALKLLGDALDRQGRFDEAYDAYASANEQFAEIHAGPNAPPVSRELVETIDEAVAGLSPGSLAGLALQDPSKARSHIFLLGYPRSGTTLTEQILATCPRVVTLEEGPTLSDSEQYLTADGIAALAVMSDEEAARLRAAYWKRVAAAGVDVTDQTFIDMDPFKGPALPLIARLFPAAKVIVMRRDPRDVVWSCFRHSFVYSPVVYEFTSLARAARHYSATMQLIRRCLETLPLTAHTVYYEDLVDDFDATTRGVCSFLGLPSSPALSDFAATARVRSVKTASAPQVRRHLFDGSGQWRNYANRL